MKTQLTQLTQQMKQQMINDELLSNNEILEKMKKNTEKLARKNSTENICNIVMKGL